MIKAPGAAGSNPYHDPELADLYAGFEYEGTYYLIARDLPQIVHRHVEGRSALDFACGAGRSTRLLKRLEFDALGVDVSERMLDQARRRDPGGDYLLIDECDLSPVSGRGFDLVLSAFPFSSTSSLEKISEVLRVLRSVLASTGRIVLVEPTPEFYRNEWLSFTSDYPENLSTKSSDPVKAAFRERIRQPVVDYLWEDGDYRQALQIAGLRLLETARPLGRSDDPFSWVSENTIPPWVIYVTGGT